MKKIYFLFSILIMVSCDTIPYNNNNNNGYSSTVTPNESREFSALMERDQIDKKRVTAEVLTYLLNSPDPEEKKTAAVIENLSSCDIIIRLVGINNNLIYNLPIARNSKNQFVIEKGNYTIKSTICGAKYYSQKNIIEPLILELSSN